MVMDMDTNNTWHKYYLTEKLATVYTFQQRKTAGLTEENYEQIGGVTRKIDLLEREQEITKYQKGPEF